MNPLHTALVTATLLSAPLLASAAGGSFDRTLHTSGTPTVSVFTSSGSIRIHPGSDIHIKANLHSSGHGFFGGSDANVQAHIQQIESNPPIQQSGDTVQIGERGHNDLYRDINIDYDITLPAGSHLDLQTGSGDVEVQGAGDRVFAHSGSGSLRLHEVHGDLKLQTGSGDVELQNAGSGSIYAQSGSGSLRLRNLQGAVDAHTGSGDIEISGRLTADSRAHTGSGSIRLDLGDVGLNVDAHTGSGSIRIAGANSGDSESHRFSGSVRGGGPRLELSTGSGDIELR